MNTKKFNAYLAEKNLKLGAVESITGGLFASSITAISGASKIFNGSLVTYQNEIKERVLGISAETIKNHGVVSQTVAFHMAEAGKKILDVDVCVSFTGNAGPTALEDQPVGLVFIGIAYKDKIVVHEVHLKGTRTAIRRQLVRLAYQKIIEIIEESDI